MTISISSKEYRHHNISTYPQEQKYQVAANKSNQDPQISPPVLKAVLQWLVELISNLVSTVLVTLMPALACEPSAPTKHQ